MAKKPFDPLTYLPSPEAVEKRLAEAELEAHRLRLLLAAVRAANAPAPGPAPVAPAGKAVGCE